jgi:uncharacterized protein (AIM24 family)
MAEFKICSLEGTHHVEAHLQEETIRAEAGALCYMTGDITLRVKAWTGPWRWLRAQLTQESLHRPTYTGTGVITLESSLGGFHILDLKDEEWILEKGAYWASDGAVDISFKRERILTSLYAGQGLIYLQTVVRGTGQVVVTTRGPVEMLTLEPGQRVACDGYYVVGRSAEVPFRMKRATVNFFGSRNAGEGRLHVFQGPGRVLINPAPYWRYRMMMERQRRGDSPSQAILEA